MKELKVKFIPYEKLKENLDVVFKELRKNSLIIVDAKLTPEEEAKIIEETMKNVNLKFKGIEISSIELKSEEQKSIVDLLRESFQKIVLGKERGITLIGSANLIKKIEKNPENLSLYI